MGRAHRVPDAQHLVEGDDSRRRATPSTLTASLQHHRGNTHLFTTSSTLPRDSVVQICTVLPSIIQYIRLMLLSLHAPKLEDCRSDCFSRSVGLVKRELPAFVVPGLWVLPNSMLILNDVMHNLLHLHKIAHVYLNVANKPPEYALENPFCSATAEVEPSSNFISQGTTTVLRRTLKKRTEIPNSHFVIRHVIQSQGTSNSDDKRTVMGNKIGKGRNHHSPAARAHILQGVPEGFLASNEKFTPWSKLLLSD